LPCPRYSIDFQVGLDAAGKTTILYKLKLGEIVTTIPTIGTFMAQSRGNLMAWKIFLFSEITE